jgi:hypothetical protein
VVARRSSGCGRSSYDLRQSKTGRRVVIPVGTPLRQQLKRSTITLTNSEGKPKTSDGFRASWGNACTVAGVVGVTFNDLRGTAVTGLALAGCTEAEIATIAGHSLGTFRLALRNAEGQFVTQFRSAAGPGPSARPSITSLTDARQFDMLRRWGGQPEEDGRGSYRTRAVNWI